MLGSDFNHMFISGVPRSSMGKPWNAIRYKSAPLRLMVDRNNCTVVPSPPFGVVSDAELSKIKGKFDVGVVFGLESFLN